MRYETFDLFWSAYPRKTAKAVALRAFVKAIQKAPLQAMLDAVAAQKQSDQWRRGVIPHAATWLNQERWNDELPATSVPMTRLAAMDVSAPQSLTDAQIAIRAQMDAEYQ